MAHTMLWMLLTVAAAAAMPATPDTTESWSKSYNDAMLRSARRNPSTSSSSSTGTTNNSNFSVSFVPLFSLIANFLPKLFSRFGQTQQHSARSADVKQGEQFHNYKSVLSYRDVVCDSLHLGKWKDKGNIKQFHLCEINTDALQSCYKLVPNNSQQADYQSNMKSELIPRDNKFDKEYENFQQVDMVKNACFTIRTFKCPNQHVYNDDTRRCDAETNIELQI